VAGAVEPPGLTDLVAEAHAAWEPRLARAVLGTDDAASVAELLTAAVEGAAGVPVSGARFYRPGVGIVAGLELADGRAVVAKVHRWRASRARLGAVLVVQRALADAGLPAPRPLAGPVPLGGGWLTVEALVDGDAADGHDPAVRRVMAAELHRFVASAPATSGLTSWWVDPPAGALWPEPHALRFDLAATAAGAGWIDAAAERARARLGAAAAPDVVGHLDWRVENLGFAGDEVVAIYDWDSVGLVPEAVLVGLTSVQHCIDWRRGEPDPLPTLDALDGFVADYGTARGTPFDPAERALVEAGQWWLAAYGARCQHSDDVLGLFPDVDHALGWPRLLRELLDRS
jgi:hypothetical protein